MIAVCDKCHAEFTWAPDMNKCPFCGAEEKYIQVYNEIN